MVRLATGTLSTQIAVSAAHADACWLLCIDPSPAMPVLHRARCLCAGQIYHTWAAKEAGLPDSVVLRTAVHATVFQFL